MALDLGTLVAYLDVDNSKLNRGATEAEARLDELQRDRKTTIEVDADTGEAEAELDAVARDRSSTINANTKGLSALWTTAIALGPALIPVAGAVAGLAGALSAPLAAAGGGLTVFGLIAGTAVAQTEKVKKQIDELRQKAATLVDPKARKAAAAQADALQKSLTAPQRMFLAAQDSLKGAFGRLVQRAGPAVFGPLISFMHTLADVLPRLQPLLKAVSHALSDVFDSIGKSVQGGGFDKFLSFFVKFSGPAIKGFFAIMVGLGKGFMGLIKAFQPMSTAIMGGLEGMAKKFGEFGANAGHNGFQGFLAYIEKVGPQVASTIGSLVGAVVNIVKALAPLGSMGLGVLKVLADVVRKIPPALLGAIASAIIAVVVAVKAWAVAQAVLDAALDANPIGLIVLAIAALVAGLIYAWKNSETFRDIVMGAIHAVGAVFKWLWNNALQPAIKFILQGFAWLEDKIGDLLDALSHIPGFGWAKDAANFMHHAADEARNMADAINKIHDKNVTLTLTTIHSVVNKNSTADEFGNRTPGGPHRAAGGPVMGGATYMVGESGPELFTPGMPGSITSTHNLRTSTGGGGGAAVFNLFDADGHLIGRMRGEARAEINGAHGFHQTVERMNR